MELRTAYIEILRNMSGFDVKNLLVIARTSFFGLQSEYPPLLRTADLPKSAKLETLGASIDSPALSEQLVISMGNLQSLGCASATTGYGGMLNFRFMVVTQSGIALSKACS